MTCYNEDLGSKTAREDLEEAIELSKKSKKGSAAMFWGRVTYKNGISHEDIKPIAQLTTLPKWQKDFKQSKKSGKYAWFSGKFGNLKVV